MADESASDPEAPTQPDRPLAELMRGVSATASPDNVFPVAPSASTVPAAPSAASGGGEPSGPTTASPSPVVPPAAKAVERAEAAFEWAKWAGVELSSFERAFAVFRRVGWLRGSALLFALTFPVVKLVWLPSLVERGVAAFVEGSGVELEAGGWSTDLLGDLAVEARDLVLRAPGPYGRDQLLSVRRARVDLSLFGRLRRGRWVHEVTIEDGEVYLEQLLSGRWNTSEVFAAPALRRQVQAFEARFEEPYPDGLTMRRKASKDPCRWYGFACLDRVQVRNVEVEWVKNWPSLSGGGLVHTSRASLHIDDLNGILHDVRLPIDEREVASPFAFEGRVADGRFSVEGEGNFFWWILEAIPGGAGERPPPPPTPRQPRPMLVDAKPPPASSGARPRSRQIRWLPQGTGQLYLENVGAAAFGLVVEPAALRPIGGTISGTVAIEFGNVYRGRGTVEVEGLQYAANRDSPLLRGRVEEVERSLDGVVIDGPLPLDFECGAGDCSGGPVAMAQASMTTAALSDAAPPVVAVARADRVLFSDTLATEGAELLESELAGLVGEEAAAELSELAAGAVLESSDPEADGAATGEAAGAARRFGRSVKRFFTRERKPG